MKIFSGFDGMSCGQIALDRMGIPVEVYYASEINEYAIAVTQHHFPKTIQLGDITEWRTWDIDWASIDLVLAGSPCQGFSNAGKGLNFDDPRSKLFFVFVDILKYIQALNPNVRFLLENVKMKRGWQDIITEFMGVEPIMIDSALVSAQSRKRLYWTNIHVEQQPTDLGIVLADIIEDGQVDREKSYCIDANYYKGGSLSQYKEKARRQIVMHQSERRLMVKTNSDRCLEIGKADIKGQDIVRRVYSPQGKSPTITKMDDGHRQPKISVDNISWRSLTPLECERLQTVADNWTLVTHPKFKGRMMSNSQRYKMLGNGWTIDVIAHILSNIQNGTKSTEIYKQLSIFEDDN